MHVKHVVLGLAGEKAVNRCYLLLLLNHSAWVVDCYHLF